MNNNDEEMKEKSNIFLIVLIIVLKNSFSSFLPSSSSVPSFRLAASGCQSLGGESSNFAEKCSKARYNTSTVRLGKTKMKKF